MSTASTGTPAVPSTSTVRRASSDANCHAAITTRSAPSASTCSAAGDCPTAVVITGTRDSAGKRASIAAKPRGSTRRRSPPIAASGATGSGWISDRVSSCIPSASTTARGRRAIVTSRPSTSRSVTGQVPSASAPCARAGRARAERFRTGKGRTQDASPPESPSARTDRRRAATGRTVSPLPCGAAGAETEGGTRGSVIRTAAVVAGAPRSIPALPHRADPVRACAAQRWPDRNTGTASAGMGRPRR